jgi:hypothetical protein
LVCANKYRDIDHVNKEPIEIAMATVNDVSR